MADLEVSGSWGVAFLVSAGIMAEIIAKAVSSPQTAELNISKRAPTLMKWVKVGLVEGAVLVAIAAAVDRKYRLPILLGGITEGVITFAEYWHAKRSGLANPGEPTEQHAGGAPAGGKGLSW